MRSGGYRRACSLGHLHTAVDDRIAAMGRARVVERIWSRDPSVWGGDDATPELTDRLGWLDVAGRSAALAPRFRALADDVRERFDHVVLCGMGGSSLAAEALWLIHGAAPGFPDFTMLDSTVPAAVRAATPTSPGRTFFVIASKSGGTLETLSLFRHFWSVAGGNGSQFTAVTDPGSALAVLAAESSFRAVIEGEPEIGGRFSALSAFGLLPATLFGLDVNRTLGPVREAEAGACAPVEENVAAWLGVVIGEAALAGRNKLTVVLPPSLASFGPWAEQLVAESTGKAGGGVLPIPEYGVPDPDRYGPDRLVVALGAGGGLDPAVEASLDALASRGHPVVRLSLASASEIGAEFYRWEFATAVAGAVLGVNPFDQPNVEESKANTRRVLDGHRVEFAAPVSSAELDRCWDDVRPGDYVALLAYVAPGGADASRLDRAADVIRRRTGVPVTVGLGPRYLHSTGQLHKGGPARGHFVQVVDDDPADLPVPGEAYTFGTLFRAQADGDLAALRSRGRPCARITPATLRELAAG